MCLSVVRVCFHVCVGQGHIYIYTDRHTHIYRHTHIRRYMCVPISCARVFSCVCRVMCARRIVCLYEIPTRDGIRTHATHSATHCNTRMNTYCGCWQRVIIVCVYENPTRDGIRVLQHTLQHAATHCNTLCNTLQHNNEYLLTVGEYCVCLWDPNARRHTCTAAKEPYN